MRSNRRKLSTTLSVPPYHLYMILVLNLPSRYSRSVGTALQISSCMTLHESWVVQALKANQIRGHTIAGCTPHLQHSVAPRSYRSFCSASFPWLAPQPAHNPRSIKPYEIRSSQQKLFPIQRGENLNEHDRKSTLPDSPSLAFNEVPKSLTTRTHRVKNVDHQAIYSTLRTP